MIDLGGHRSLLFGQCLSPYQNPGYNFSAVLGCATQRVTPNRGAQARLNTQGRWYPPVSRLGRALTSFWLLGIDHHVVVTVHLPLPAKGCRKEPKEEEAGCAT